MQIRLTPAVKALAIACLAIFVANLALQALSSTSLVPWLALTPSLFAINHRVWQVVTYALVHEEPMHLFFNLLTLVFIGGEIETLWGTKRFLRYFFACSITAGFIYLLLQLFVMQGHHVPMMGASGGIYGLLIAYGLIFGERVMLFMMLFPMKAKHFIWILAGVEFLTTLSGRGGLSGVAHLSGMGTGFLMLWGRASWTVLKRQRQEKQESSRRDKKRQASKHLKLVVSNRGGPGAPADPNDDADGDPKTWH